MATAKKLEHKIVVALEEGKITEDRACKLLIDADNKVDTWMGKEERKKAQLAKQEALRTIKQL